MEVPKGDADLLRAMDASFADAAARAGDQLACRLGCTQCCHGAFAISTLDAARLRAGMLLLRAEDPSRAGHVEQRALAWIQDHGGEFPGDRATGRLGESEWERVAFEDFANEAACPALDPATGACDLYAHRPMTCRVFGPPVRLAGEGLGCCELCFTKASPEKIKACEMQLPSALEDALLAAMPATGDTIVAFTLLK